MGLTGTRLRLVRPTGRPDGGRAGRRWVPVLVAALAGAAVLLAAVAGRLDGAPSADAVEVLALLLLLVLASFLGLEFRARGEGDRLDLFDAALAAALVSLPAPSLLAVVVVAKALALGVQRVPADKLAFNVAQWGCAAAAGSLLFAALPQPAGATARELALLLAALVLVAAVNAGSVLLVLVAVGGRSLTTLPGDLLRGSVVSGVVNVVLGLLVAMLWTQEPAVRLVIPVVLVGAHLASRGWVQQRTGESRLEGLRRASDALSDPTGLATALPRFLDELRASSDCRGVVLHLQVGSQETSTRLTSGEDVGQARTAALVAALLRTGRTVQLGPAEGPPELLELLLASGWRDCLAVPVRFETEVVGLLCTYDRQGWQRSGSAERSVLEAAAGVLGEKVHRGELAAVLHAERAALRDSELRWQALASLLGQVSSRAPLPETLAVLTRTLEEQTGLRCGVLVRTPDTGATLVAPHLPAAAAGALQQLLDPELSSPRPVDVAAERHVGDVEDDAGRAALRSAGVRTVRSWRLPCSPDTGAEGVLALCYRGDRGLADHAPLAAGAARVGALAVDHVLVQRQLVHQAGHDALTDLPNRAVFLDRLGRALRASQRGATSVLVLFLDLDRFKLVNDSLGHRAGDALLRAVAARLSSAVRPGDTVARFGGDEFTVLCEGIEDEAHALQVVQRVQEVLEVPFAVEDSELFATASIGIALGRGSDQSPDTLLDDADAAMYRAKERGGNCYELFDTAMRDRAVRRLATQSALHRAIERGEFQVVYQPIVSLPTGALEGAEALVRWHRPEHGVVQPTDFVPLAEETGLIVPIGALVLEAACEQARRWQDAARGRAAPWISVNLSANQLADPGLVPLVRSALQRNRLDPSAIHLEITESVLVHDLLGSAVALGELRDLGVRLYIDDFGTGYSSLTYLQRLPVDGLKLDRSFVSGLGADAGADAIVGAVIGLAHGLGLTTVAEGVETEEQVRHLVDLDCDTAQGYHFGRPGSGDLVLPVTRAR